MAERKEISRDKGEYEQRKELSKKKESEERILQREGKGGG